MARKKSSTRYLELKPFFSLATLFFVFLALAIWLVFNHSNLLQFFHHYSERNKEIAEIKVLEKNILDLEEQKEILETGGFENEKIIRERYRMIKPGEKIVIVEREDNS